ncbi:MAG TPA: hypothetical protein VEL07_16410 [Planctomycetota bacterium]|nr:hypothetical protein [Planctomycetota bacterium]
MDTGGIRDRTLDNGAPCATNAGGGPDDLGHGAARAMRDDWPLPAPSIMEGGRSSNTPPPAATDHEAKPSASGVVCLPVVCDTVYVTFDAALMEWARVVCGKSESDPRRAHYRTNVDGVERVVVPYAKEPPPPDVCWVFHRGTLAGFASYRWRIDGVGEWKDVRLLVGEVRRVREKSRDGQRSFLLMIGSSVLWQARGRGQGAADVVRWILRSLANLEAGRGLLDTAPGDVEVKPNRIDLCVDHWGYDWAPGDLHRFASRARRSGDVTSGGDYITEDRRQFGAEHPTLYLGSSRSECRELKVYLKTAEAEKTGKLTWMEPIWRQFGWQPGIRVWRAEVRFGGIWLRSHGMRTLADMCGAERELWKHYVENVRHGGGTSTRRRRDGLSPVWKALSSANCTLRSGTWKWTPRAASLHTDLIQLGRMTAGCIARIESLLLEGAGAMTTGATGGPWQPSRATQAREDALALVVSLLDERSPRRRVA